MSIHVISAWYNEEYLAPFFLEHYRYADMVTVLVDDLTDDNTIEICKRYGVDVRMVRYSNDSSMDEWKKACMLSDLYRASGYEYVVNVDADEYVFGGRGEVESGYDIRVVKLWQVYRHADEQDLDLRVSVREQRRHGVYVWPYSKPVVVRTGQDLRWYSGNHSVRVNGHHEVWRHPEENVGHYGPEMTGAHWVMADPAFCIARRLTRKVRHYHTGKYGELTSDMLAAECMLHQNDPKLW